MKHIDYLLDRITMYRLVLYILIGQIGMGVILANFKQLHFSPLALGERREALAFKRAIDYGVSLAPIASSLFADGFSLNEWLDRQGVPASVMGVSKVQLQVAAQGR
ncbi:MAG TPA: hypothetical protein VFQ36_06005 [Ktedonobacteraceae bacterium]|nr:hypothetical protein [Ktedonobacteraceae bacterium]